MMPLINSQYARENPGKIPYSSCSLQGSLMTRLQPGLARFGEISDIVWVKCFSKKHGLISKIPVKIIYSDRAGLDLGSKVAFLDLELRGLHGKSVEQLFGTYKGGTASFASLSLQRHVNSHKISLRGLTLSNMFLGASFAKFKLDKNMDERIGRFHRDPYMLFARTDYKHSETTLLFDDIYFFINEPGRQMSQIKLRVADGEVHLSTGSDLLIDQKCYKKLVPRLISAQGEVIYLLQGTKRMDDRMILLKKGDGTMAYQTLQGTFVYRPDHEHRPDFEQLSELQFVKDDTEILLFDEVEEVEGSLNERLLGPSTHKN